MGKLFDITLGNKREKRRAKNQFAQGLFGKKTVFLVGAGIMGYVILKNVSYSGSPKAAKHPAFTYPAGQTMDDQTEGKLINAILSHRGANQELHMSDGSKLTESVYQQLLADFNAAIAYYPDRPQKNLEKVRDDLVEYKDQIVAKADNVGMGPISGFGGVY